MKQKCRQLLRNGEIISSAGAMDIRKHCMYRNENIPDSGMCHTIRQESGTTIQNADQTFNAA